jgi:hypothetical protein
MNYGRFFKLNIEKSDLSKGIAFFDYLWLKDEQAHGTKETPEFPVYVIITKECIEFKVHFWEKSLQNHPEIHLHNTILTLPLSTNLEVKDGLTMALVEAYNTNFPSSNNKYLRRLIDKAKSPDTNTNCYSDLNCFNIKDEITRAYPVTENITWFIRKLILDFIFDLEHSKVFQNSPFYEHISVRLKENFFFNALANKAEYYYYREIAEKKKKEEEGSKLFFLREYFFPVEERWVNSIMNPASSNYFVKKRGEHGWFDNPEKELKKSKGKNTLWFHRKLSYCKLRKEQSDKKDKEQFKKNKKELKLDIRVLAKKSSQWQLLKFDFSNGLYTIWAGSICCIFSFIVMKMIQQGYEKWECSLCPLFIGAIILLPGIIIDCLKRNKLYLHLFFPRLLAAIMTVWITLSFSEDIIKTFHNVKYSPLILYVAIPVLSVLGVSIFIMNEIQKTSPYLKWAKKLWRAIQLSAVAFLYSYVTGILITAFIGIKFLENNTTCYKESAIKICRLDLYIFPDYLLLFSFIAMFIGIFINLILEDKHITNAE